MSKKKKEGKIEIKWKTGWEILQERINITRISTETSIDQLIGGGIEEGEVIEFYGGYGTGKSQLCFTIAVLVAEKERGGKVKFIDAEATWKPERIREIAESRGLNGEKILKKIQVTNPATVEELVASIESIKNNKPKLVVVDSLTSLFREEYIGRENLIVRQGKLRKFIHELKMYAKKTGAVIVVTNQVYGKPSGTSFPAPLYMKQEAVGGDTLYHMIDVRIFLRKAKKGLRLARLMDSSMYPPGERLFRITEKGTDMLAKCEVCGREFPSDPEMESHLKKCRELEERTKKEIEEGEKKDGTK